MTTLEFFDGRLMVIEDPLQGFWSDKELSVASALRKYGFPMGDSGDRIGPEFGIHAEIIGPREGENGSTGNYQWVVSWDTASLWFPIWCRTSIEMHNYLIFAAPLFQVSLWTGIEEHVATADRWLFDDQDGLFSQHIQERRKLNRQWRKIREEQAAMKKAKS